MTRIAEWVARRAGVTRCAFVAVAVGLVVTAAVPVPAWLAWCALAAAGVGLTATLFGLGVGVAGRARAIAIWGVLSAALCAGLLVGSLRVSTLTRSTLDAFVGQRCTVDAVVGSGAVGTKWGARCVLVVERAAIGTGPSLGIEPESVRLEVSGVETRSTTDTGATTSHASTAPAGDGTYALTEGSRVRVAGRLLAPSDGAEGGFDQRAALRREGVAVILRASFDDVTRVGGRGGLAGVFDRLRVAAHQHLSLGLRPRESGWLRGVVLGEQDAVDADTLAALRRSGTAHILSVGGLHLASLAAVMLAAVRLLRGPRLLGYLLGGGAAWLFVPLVGASPPVMRAAVVLAFVLATEASGRGRDRWQIYAAAAALTLALNPFSLFSLSFQLSFVAAAGLMVLTRPVQRRLGFLPAALAAGVATSVAATLATAPLSLLAFDQVALMGVAGQPARGARPAGGDGRQPRQHRRRASSWHPLSAVLNVGVGDLHGVGGLGGAGWRPADRCSPEPAWFGGGRRGGRSAGRRGSPMVQAPATPARRRTGEGRARRVRWLWRWSSVGVIAGVLGAQAVGRLSDVAIGRAGRAWVARADRGARPRRGRGERDAHPYSRQARGPGRRGAERGGARGPTAGTRGACTRPRGRDPSSRRPLRRLGRVVERRVRLDDRRPRAVFGRGHRVRSDGGRDGATGCATRSGRRRAADAGWRGPAAAYGRRPTTRRSRPGCRRGGRARARRAPMERRSTPPRWWSTVRAGRLAILLPGDAEAEVLQALRTAPGRRSRRATPRQSRGRVVPAAGGAYGAVGDRPGRPELIRPSGPRDPGDPRGVGRARGAYRSSRMGGCWRGRWTGGLAAGDGDESDAVAAVARIR